MPAQAHAHSTAAGQMHIYALQVSATGSCAENMASTVVLKEDSRRLTRMVKRVVVLISDLEPYLSAGCGPILMDALQVRAS